MTTNSEPVSTATLAGLVVLALIPRLALFAAGPARDPERALHADSRRYVVLAGYLAFHGFGKPEEDGQVHRGIARLRSANGTLPAPDANGLRPESFRTPGYPCFLALALDGGIRAALIVQDILGALLVYVVVVVAQAAGVGRRGAVLAGVLWALHPGLVVYDNLILTENLFNVGCLTGLWIAARARGALGWCSAGLVLGCACLVRPLGFLYVPAACALTWQQTPARYRSLAMTVLFALIPPAGWAVRNNAVGEGLRVSSVGDINLLYYSAAYAISEERAEDWLQSWPQRVDELTLRLEQQLRPGEDVVAAARRLAIAELRARPVIALRVHAKSMFKLFCDHSLGLASELVGIPYQPSGLFSRLVLRDRTEAAGGSWGTLALSLAWMLLNVATLLMALWGLARAVRRRSWTVVVTGGATTVLFAIATGAVGLERFRMPIMFPLFLLVGYCVAPGVKTASDGATVPGRLRPQPLQ